MLRFRLLKQPLLARSPSKAAACLPSREVLHSPCSKCRLPSNTIALITSGCGYQGGAPFQREEPREHGISGAPNSGRRLPPPPASCCPIFGVVDHAAGAAKSEMRQSVWRLPTALNRMAAITPDCGPNVLAQHKMALFTSGFCAARSAGQPGDLHRPGGRAVPVPAAAHAARESE